MVNPKSVKAVIKYSKLSPYKVRKILNQIRGRSYVDALMILKFLPYAATDPIKALLDSAASNANYIYKLNKNQLVIDKIFADEGPKLKRNHPRAKGKTVKILKPTCHITVIMIEKIY